MHEAQFHPSPGDWGFTCCVVWPKHKSSSLKTRNCNQRFSLLLNEKLPFWPNLDQLDAPSPVFQNKIRELDSGKILLNSIAHHWARVAITKLFLSFLLLSPQNWVISTPFPNLILQVLMDIVKLQHLSKKHYFAQFTQSGFLLLRINSP